MRGVRCDFARVERTETQKTPRISKAGRNRSPDLVGLPEGIGDSLTPSQEVTMAGSTRNTVNKPPRSKEEAQKIVESGKPSDDGTLSDDDLKRVSGGSALGGGGSGKF